MIKVWVMRLLGLTHGGLTCPEVGELLQQYLDGTIDDDRVGQIEIHLEECRRCGLEADVYERIKVTLAAQRRDLPADSVERLRAFGEQLARGEDPTTA
jgi:anti-sigma factor RsiW